MKKNLRLVVYLMIVVVVAAGIYLWSSNGRGEEVLQGLDPESYDAEVTCSSIEGNNLICNAGNDIYLFLDHPKVYIRNYDVKIKENGDEEVKVSYKDFSLENLEKEIKEKGEVPVYLWLTSNGKISTIMVSRESFENNNASLANLDGLDPGTHTATKVILAMNQKEMRLAPAGYTVETADKFEDKIGQYRFAKNVKFYRGTVTTTVKSDGSRKRNIQYAKDSFRAIKERLGQGLSAHIWYDENGNISIVLVHEEEVVLE